MADRPSIRIATHTKPSAMRAAIRRARVVYVECLGKDDDTYHCRTCKKYALEEIHDEREGFLRVCEWSDGRAYLNSAI
jgi:hypothetical protein